MVGLGELQAIVVLNFLRSAPVCRFSRIRESPEEVASAIPYIRATSFHSPRWSLYLILTWLVFSSVSWTSYSSYVSCLFCSFFAYVLWFPLLLLPLPPLPRFHILPPLQRILRPSDRHLVPGLPLARPEFQDDADAWRHPNTRPPLSMLGGRCHLRCQWYCYDHCFRHFCDELCCAVRRTTTVLRRWMHVSFSWTFCSSWSASLHV